MASLRKRGKIWYYRFVDADGGRRERKGSPDRRATAELAAAAEMTAAKVRAGILDPKTVALGEHEARPLSEHLGDWHTDLVGRGSTAHHALVSRNRVTRLVELARVKRISELVPSKVQAALKQVRDAGASLASIRHYTRTAKSFSKWLQRDGRAASDTLAHLTSRNPAEDRRRERRALTADEADRLIRAAGTGPMVLKIGGHDRAMLYRLALGTGFRVNELRSLEPESFDLSSSPPTVTVRAAFSKRRREDRQPIRVELADALRPWIAEKPPRRPLFDRLTKHTSRLIRIDLEAAGVPYRDAGGRYADFHALRHTYISGLANSGAPVKVVQTLARHSTPVLTFGVYTHVVMDDLTSALNGAISDSAAPRVPTEAVPSCSKLSLSDAQPTPKSESVGSVTTDPNFLRSRVFDEACSELSLRGPTPNTNITDAVVVFEVMDQGPIPPATGDPAEEPPSTPPAAGDLTAVKIPYRMLPSA